MVQSSEGVVQPGRGVELSVEVVGQCGEGIEQYGMVVPLSNVGVEQLEKGVVQFGRGSQVRKWEEQSRVGKAANRRGTVRGGSTAGKNCTERRYNM